MINIINPPWHDQYEWHRMTRMTGPDFAVMCNLINTQRERGRERMNRMTGPDCPVMCNLRNTHACAREHARAPKEEQGTGDGKEKTVTGTGTRAGTGTRMMSTRARMGAKARGRTETRIEMRVEGRESLGTSKVVTEIGWKTREGGRPQRVTSNHTRKTRRPSETVASCGVPEPRGGTRGAGSGRGGAGAKNHKKLQRSYRRDVENVKESGGRIKRREESVG